MHFRINIRKNEADPSKDLEVAADLRRDIWAHSPVEIDPDDPSTATRRAPDTRIAFFEFDTDYADEVYRVIREYNYSNSVDVVATNSPQQSTGV